MAPARPKKPAGRKPKRAAKIVFTRLDRFLRRIPSMGRSISTGGEDGLRWVKFGLDIDHPLAWRVVQELGHVLNYISVSDRLPAVFMPVSPPVYLNGGPREFLSWVIESKAPDFTPKLCSEWLRGRLPRPVDNLEAWDLEE